MYLKKILILALFCFFVFLSFSRAKADTTTVFVGDTNAYKGYTQTEVPVYIDNIDQNIQGFTLIFSLSAGDRAYFSTDHFKVSIDTICKGTIRPCPHDSIISIDTTISRVLKIDKSGSLTSNFPTLEARGDAGDTTSPYCVGANVLGIAPISQPIGPGFGLLFKLYLNILCVPDTSLPDTSTYINVYATLAQGDTLVREKKTLAGRLFIFGGIKYGDANADNKITVADVVYLISYLFKGGTPPVPVIKGDANGDGKVTVADVVYLISYLFKGGPVPHCFGT
ncbi:MAG TPA: dockerin type I repeat-containing protein [Terriglobales bacterium]|nr:dockerin type I repeat-containing protein [Terriglobales bacterium]